MNTFPVDKPISIDPVDTSGPTTAVGENSSSAIVQKRAQDISVLTSGDVPVDQTLQEASMGDKRTPVSIRSDTLSKIDVGKVVQDGIDQRLPVEDLTANSNDVINKTKDLQNLPVSVKTELMAINHDFNALQVRTSSRLSWAESVVLDKIKAVNADTSFVGKIGDFIDSAFIRQIPIGAIEGITGKSTKVGEDIVNLAINAGTTAEFKTKFLEKLDVAASQGVLTSNNLFRLQSFLESTAQGSDVASAGTDKVMGVIDIATLGLTAVSKVSAIAKGAKAASMLKRLNKAETSIEEAVALQGPDKAAEVAAKVINKTADAEVADATLPPTLKLSKADLSPNVSKVTQRLEESSIVRKIQHIVDTGAAGNVASKAEETVLAAKLVDKIINEVSRPIASTTSELVPAGKLGEKAVVVRFGKTAKGSEGTAFKTEASARKVASKIEGAKVESSTTGDGFFVTLTDRLDVSGVTTPLDLNPVFNNIIGELTTKFLGSKPLRDMNRLNVPALQGEGATSAILKTAKSEMKDVLALSPKERLTLDRIFEKLRDGSDSFKREAYTPDEFRVAWKQQTGEFPNPKQEKAYQSLQDISDAHWLMDASASLMKFVSKGFKSVSPDGASWFTAKKIEEIPKDELFKLSKEDQVKALKGSPVWKLEKPIEQQNGQLIEYIVKPKGTRILQYEDVMGFNAGGRRSNSGANFFIMSSDAIDGTRLRPRAILTAFTTKQAKLATAELNTLTKAERDGALTDELVTANNTWNPNIETADEFQAFAKDNKIGSGRKIEYKGRDEPIKTVDQTNPFHGDTHEAFFRHDNIRNDKPLIEFGGNQSRSVDPVSSMAQSFNTASQRLGMRAFTIRALNSWLKTASEMGGITLNRDLALSPMQQFKQAQFTGSGSDVRRLKELHSIISSRLNIKSGANLWLENVGDHVAEYLSDALGKQIKLPTVEGKLLQLGLHTKLGLLNPSQFIVQYQQVANIISIAPKHGLIGAGRAMATRMLISLDDVAAEAEATKRFARVAQMTEADAKELVTYLKTSGRGIVGGDALEAGTGAELGLSGFMGDSFLKAGLAKGQKVVKVTLKAGLIPFTEGELQSRLTAINTAFSEFKSMDKFKGVSALSDEGRAWIANRESTLNFNMTTGSRAANLSGILKVPAQWMAFNLNAMEAIIFSKELTKMEKARVAIVMGPMFGLTGVGSEFGAEKAAEILGYKLGSDEDTAIRHGIQSVLLKRMTGVEVSLGGRLSPFLIFRDLQDKLNKSPVELAVGPSGAILRDITTAVYDVWKGGSSFIQEDLIRVARQVSSVDNAFKALGMYQDGLLRSKNGRVVNKNARVSEIALQAIGITSTRAVEQQQNDRQAYLSFKNFKKYKKDVQRLSAIAARNWGSSNPDDHAASLQQYKDLDIMINHLVNLSTTQKDTLRRSILKDASPSYIKQVQAAIREGNLEAAKRSLQLGEGN